MMPARCFEDPYATTEHTTEEKQRSAVGASLVTILDVFASFWMPLDFHLLGCKKTFSESVIDKTTRSHIVLLHIDDREHAFFATFARRFWYATKLPRARITLYRYCKAAAVFISTVWNARVFSAKGWVTTWHANARTNSNHEKRFKQLRKLKGRCIDWTPEHIWHDECNWRTQNT